MCELLLFDVPYSHRLSSSLPLLLALSGLVCPRVCFNHIKRHCYRLDLVLYM